MGSYRSSLLRNCFALTVTFALFQVSNVVGEDHGSIFSFESGEYIFHTTMKGTPSDRGDLKFVAQLKVGNDGEKGRVVSMTARPADPHLRFHAKKEIECEGVLKGNILKMYMSDVVDDGVVSSIASIHFIGELVANNQAKGTLTMMANGEIGDRGNWTLEKAK